MNKTGKQGKSYTEKEDAIILDYWSSILTLGEIARLVSKAGDNPRSERSVEIRARSQLKLPCRNLTNIQLRRIAFLEKARQKRMLENESAKKAALETAKEAENTALKLIYEDCPIAVASDLGPFRLKRPDPSRYSTIGNAGAMCAE